MELHEGDLANLGVGMANGISYVALEEGFLQLHAHPRAGVFGRLPGVGLDSGTAIDPSAIIDMPSPFDFSDGGGLDFAGLAFAQVDRWQRERDRGRRYAYRPRRIYRHQPEGAHGRILREFPRRWTVDRCRRRIAPHRRDGRYAKFVDASYITFNADCAPSRQESSTSPSAPCSDSPTAVWS